MKPCTDGMLELCIQFFLDPSVVNVCESLFLLESCCFSVVDRSTVTGYTRVSFEPLRSLFLKMKFQYPLEAENEVVCSITRLDMESFADRTQRNRIRQTSKPARQQLRVNEVSNVLWCCFSVLSSEVQLIKAWPDCLSRL